MSEEIVDYDWFRDRMKNGGKGDHKLTKEEKQEMMRKDILKVLKKRPMTYRQLADELDTKGIMVEKELKFLTKEDKLTSIRSPGHGLIAGPIYWGLSSRL